MALDLLRVQNLRNIHQLEIEPEPGINLICGSNGAGKTSILEAIFLIGRGRSFRGGRISSLVREGEDELAVFGIGEQGHASESRVGYALRRGKTTMRLNGQNVKKISEVASRIPLQLMTPRSHEILERGPDTRRRFIEWGVFHVEPDYFSCYKRYRRALAQRNAALRSNPKMAKAWDSELAISGETLNDYREAYINFLEKRLAEETKALAGEQDVTIHWQRGWKRDLQLGEALLESYETDRAKGYTVVGPHRGDFVLRSGSVRASERVSRGQQKLLVASLQLAQAWCTAEKGSNPPMILVDDLGAELDREHQKRFLDRLSSTSSQVFITSLASDLCEWPANVFHVEHGAIR